MAKKKVITDEEEFPSNSKSSRVAPIREARLAKENEESVEPRKIRRIARGPVIRKKKSFTQSIAEALVGNGSDNVGGYILYDVLLPAAKNTIQEMVTSGIEMLLFGEARGGSRSRGRDRDRSTISYGSFYKKSRDDDDRKERRRPSYRDRFDLNDIYFKDHSDAEDVLDELCELLEDYEEVTVSDYFDLAGIEGATWAHTKYGWNNLRKAYCTHTKHGWAIVLPDPIELD